MHEPHFLGFDIGGTKTAWGLFRQDGTFVKGGKTATPQDKEELLGLLTELIDKQPVAAVGIGIAGTVSANHEDIIVTPNIPSLSHVQLGKYLEEACHVIVTIDNDARCALIGEVWKGCAQEFSSAVMLTLGTGLGGAVMQKEIILPHPEDINRELGRIMVDPNDVFPAPSGPGTAEAFLGGKNLEDRLGISLSKMADKVRDKNEEAIGVWEQISYFFIQVVRAIHMEYACKNIIIGGVGAKDLEFYLQGQETPCPVMPAKLGEAAGQYGAARLAIDLYEERQRLEEDWDPDSEDSTEE